ncbi:MAG: hypothetical protein FJ214_11620 [Ignavibacteria bacterium]|nr:hypothetical protein [Ignavibacteria bacterium]
MNRSIVVEQIIKNAAVAVIRMEDSKKLLRVVEAIYKGGVKVIEITLTVPDAINLIKTVVKEVGNEVIVGVGSVLNKELTEQSIDAGAKYVVSPIFKTEIIDAAHKYEIPALSTALNYFDGFRNGRLPANLL